MNKEEAFKQYQEYSRRQQEAKDAAFQDYLLWKQEQASGLQPAEPIPDQKQEVAAPPSAELPASTIDQADNSRTQRFKDWATSLALTPALLAAKAGIGVPGIDEGAIKSYEAITGEKYLTPEEIYTLPDDEREAVQKRQANLLVSIGSGAYDAVQGLVNLGVQGAVNTVGAVSDVASGVPVGDVIAEQTKNAVGLAHDVVKGSVESLAEATTSPLQQAQRDPFEFLANVATIGTSTTGTLKAAEAARRGALKEAARYAASSASDVSGLPLYHYSGPAALKDVNPTAVADATPGLSPAAAQMAAEGAQLTVPRPQAISLPQQALAAVPAPVRSFVQNKANAIKEAALDVGQGILRSDIGVSQAVRDLTSKDSDFLEFMRRRRDPLEATPGFETVREPGLFSQLSNIEDSMGDSLRSKLTKLAQDQGVFSEADAASKGWAKLHLNTMNGKETFFVPHRDARYLRQTASKFGLLPQQEQSMLTLMKEARQTFGSFKVAFNFPSWVNAVAGNIVGHTMQRGIVGGADYAKTLIGPQDKALVQAATELGLLNGADMLTDQRLRQIANSPNVVEAVGKDALRSMAETLKKIREGVSESSVGRIASTALNRIDNTSKALIIKRTINDMLRQKGLSYKDAFSHPDALKEWIRLNEPLLKQEIEKVHPDYSKAGTAISWLDEHGIMPFSRYAERSLAMLWGAAQENPTAFRAGYQNENKDQAVAVSPSTEIRSGGFTPYVNPKDFVGFDEPAGRVNFGGVPGILLDLAKGQTSTGRAIDPKSDTLKPGGYLWELMSALGPGVLTKGAKAALEQNNIVPAPLDPVTGQPDYIMSLLKVVAPVQPKGTSKEQELMTFQAKLADLEKRYKRLLQEVSQWPMAQRLAREKLIESDYAREKFDLVNSRPKE